MDGDWECESQLGSGGFGIVHVWRNKRTGQRLALKKCKFGSEISLTQKHKAAWGKEVDIMLRLQHPGVVSCLPTPEGLDPGTRELPTLCMEFCEAGDLRRLLNKPAATRGLEEGQVLAILNDVTSALGYLHNRRIIHRDLKPENVVLKQEESRLVYKLIDLGYAKELGVSSMAQSFVGTLQYVAPELFLGNDYSKSVDYWSLGLLCHEIVTGQRPFLPNMSPGQWIDLVESKRYDHISVRESLDGKVENFNQLPQEVQISPLLSRALEGWLRSLLDWRSATRGKDIEENVTVFTQLNTILSTKRLCLLCLSSGRWLYIPVRDCDTVASISASLAKESGVPADAQVLLPLSGSDLPLPKDEPVAPFVAAASSPHLILLSLQQPGPSQPDFLKQSLVIPLLVSAALKDPKRGVSDYHQRRMFAHGYHFITQQEQILRLEKQSLAITQKILRNQMLALKSCCESLGPRLVRLEAKHSLFKESLHHDLERYEEQAGRKERVTSQRMLQHWTQTGSELDRLVAEVSERVSLVVGEINSVEKQLSENHSQDNVVAQDGEMRELVGRSLEGISSLRRERGASRVDSSPRQMAQLVVKMLKRRESLRQEAYTTLVEVREVALQLRDLQLAVRILDTDLVQTEKGVTRAQLRRQNDVWTLLAAAVGGERRGGGGRLGGVLGASDSAYGSENDLLPASTPAQSLVRGRSEPGGREGKREEVGGVGDFVLDVGEEERVLEENSRLRRNWIE